MGAPCRSAGRSPPSRSAPYCQNLAAVATDLGIDPQTLVDALVDAWSPGIDNALAAGSITEQQADAYRAALEEAFAFRVNWDGEEATPAFEGM